MNEKDEILAGYLIKDNHEAFTELYVRYHDMTLYNFCYQIHTSKMLKISYKFLSYGSIVKK